jgi:hypothetical protein
MPKLIRLYIISVAIGFALSAVFLVLLILADIAGLRHLVMETSSGWVAGTMLFVMNGIVFAGVQFAIAIMRMAEDDNTPRGGLRAPNVLRLLPVKIAAKPRAKSAK